MSTPQNRTKKNIFRIVNSYNPDKSSLIRLEKAHLLLKNKNVYIVRWFDGNTFRVFSSLKRKKIICFVNHLKKSQADIRLCAKLHIPNKKANFKENWSHGYCDGCGNELIKDIDKTKRNIFAEKLGPPELKYRMFLFEPLFP